MSFSPPLDPRFQRLRPLADERATQKTGSSLLVTLLVVSLLLVVVLSFSVFVRMELRQVLQKQQHVLAQKNAKMAGELALAHLQELTGPDQRITMPA